GRGRALPRGIPLAIAEKGERDKEKEPSEESDYKLLDDFADGWIRWRACLCNNGHSLFSLETHHASKSILRPALVHWNSQAAIFARDNAPDVMSHQSPQALGRGGTSTALPGYNAAGKGWRNHGARDCLAVG